MNDLPEGVEDKTDEKYGEEMVGEPENFKVRSPASANRALTVIYNPFKK